MKIDLIYKTNGIFTTFYPESKAGEVPYKQILENPDTRQGKIYTIHLKGILSQLRKAGYEVKKSKKASKKEIEESLNQIFNDTDFKKLVDQQ